MNELEQLVEAERRRGWFVTLTAAKEGWTCSLSCGVDLLPGNIPRPFAGGATAYEAAVEATLARDRLTRKAA